MIEDRPRTHYEVLDIPMNSTPETIREAYVRAKNAYSSQSLAAYSLFSPEESKQIVKEIEEAYSTLSDSQRRKVYDREHGFMISSSDASPRIRSEELLMEEGEEVADIGFSDDPDDLITDHEHSVNILGVQEAFEFGIESDKKKVTNLANAWGTTDSPDNVVDSDFAIVTPASDSPDNQLIDAMESVARGELTENLDSEDEFFQVTDEMEVAGLSENTNSTFTEQEQSTPDTFSTLAEESGPLRTGATNHFALHGHYIQTTKEENTPNFGEMIEQAEKIDGALLRKLRDLKNITIDEIMEFTKLSRKYVDAIERDDLEKLPAPVYVRGFVTQYAKALRLDTKTIAAGYMRNFQDLRESRGIR